ncbi:MAG: flagellar hook-associated protein FlgK [Verrucomicrobia bacterium]|jgi:flagellar hook-associated protein 1|nr:flagellar hook-associated protein FlgK [Verrucomicrobiota bacterium]MBT5063772.1 flagellar hook-associated protein FlgK [Verrucomicrobiota bacterium]MBT5477470.1 flagellar hook-associated protein FlgK [Verrucomicrobiota bacterium]MBT6238690.1 flagellar hook-associated protein FlgK [Verrucomicrobiota bacterium]MBT6805617.1 flagellar hook-associated protein FlgK [Verrucomicrobiota bacterium]
MSGLLGTLDMGQRALQTQMKGLELTGHNLANVNNPNYSRQRIEVSSTYQVDAGMDSRGTGVGVVTIQQIRDQILDSQIRSEKSVTGFLESRMTGLDYIQTGMGSVLNPFGQEGAGGLDTQLENLIASMHDVSSDPSSRTSRHMFLDAADTLATEMRSVDQQIQQLEDRWDDELNLRVEETNLILDQVASLNQSIQKAERGGANTANDLRDQRVKTLESLSELIPIDVNSDANGRLQINVNGVSVIDGETVVSRLSAEAQQQGAPAIFWQPDGQAFTPSEGRLGGIQDIRNTTLLEIRNQINAIAEDLIQTMNQSHSQGFALDDSNGRDLFIGQNASDIQVNQDLKDHPEWLQASSRQGETGNNETISNMINEMQASRAGLGERTYVEAHADLVAQLGQSIRSSRSDLEDQQAMEALMINQRESISGVSLDEEMTQLVKYQRAFQASARLVSIVDDMLSTIVTMGR